MKLIESIRKWKADFKKKCAIRREETLRRTSCEVFNLKEFRGHIWLTHNGGLVCPADMLAKDIVVLIEQMRDLYVMRHK